MKLIFAATLAFLAVVPLEAQTFGKVWVYGQNVEQRASTRIGYWRTDVSAGVGEVVLSYGRPSWKPEYKGQLDAMTRGKMWRMGDNYWSLFDTNLPVKVGGVDVEPGLYYLAVRRSQDGAKWELVFIDPVKSRASGLDSYDVGTRPHKIPILFSAPLDFHKTEDAVEQLTAVMKLNQGSRNEGTMVITWGNLSLSTSVVTTLPEGF